MYCICSFSLVSIVVSKRILEEDGAHVKQMIFVILWDSRFVYFLILFLKHLISKQNAVADHDHNFLTVREIKLLFSFQNLRRWQWGLEKQNVDQRLLFLYICSVV